MNRTVVEVPAAIVKKPGTNVLNDEVVGWLTENVGERGLYELGVGFTGAWAKRFIASTCQICFADPRHAMLFKLA